MGMTTNQERIGSFTSSQIYRLMGSAKLRATYIEEKTIENRMGRSLETETYARQMAWGKFMEMFVFEHFVGLEYQIASTDTDVHPQINKWSGSKDLIVEGEKIADIKCYYPKKFAQYTDVLLAKDLNALRHKFPQEYWQLVSNAVINQVPKAEAITFMPYQSQLNELREFVEQYEGDDLWQYRFIHESPDDVLPYLPDDGYYKNINKFEFTVPQDDINLLTNAVLSAINEMRTKK